MTEMEPKGSARLRFRKGRLWLALALFIGMAGLVGWWAWPRHPGPTAVEVPEVSVNEDEPMVKSLVEEMRGKVRREPGSAQAWGRLGQVLLANSYNRQALTCLEQAERLDPRDPRWPFLRAWRLLLEDPDQALPPLRRAVEICEQAGDANTAPRLTLVDALLEKGDLEEAEQHLQRALAQEPENPHAQLARGLLALEHNDLAVAERCFQSVSASPYARKKACTQLAVVYQRRGQTREAAEYARKAAELPDDLRWSNSYTVEAQEWAVSREARYKEADQLEREGRTAEQLRLLAQLAHDFPGDHSQAALGVALAKAQDYDRAEKPLRAALRLAPDKVANCYALAVVLVKQGERYQRQGQAEAAHSRFEEAVEWARKATKGKPDHGMAHVYQGLALKHLGKRREAIRSFEEAVRCQPELADTHLRLGEALAEEGQMSRARACLKTAAELAGKDDDRPRAALARLEANEQRPK